MSSTPESPARGLVVDKRQPRLRATAHARLTAANWAGSVAARAARLARRGSGHSIRGQVMLRLDPAALPKLMANKRVALVSGTNGKTTTTHLLSAAVRASLGQNARRLVHNDDGASRPEGIAAALSASPGADIAILDTDERVVADLIRLGRPEVVVLLNVSGDQTHRQPDTTALGGSWRHALAAAGSEGPVVVANADDPLVVWAVQTAKRVIWVKTATAWTPDASICPGCGATLLCGPPGQTGGSGRNWHCSGCELAEPTGDYAVQDGKIIDAQRQVWNPKLSVPGAFNVSNAACALAAAELMGVHPGTAFVGMRKVTAPAGRFATVHFGETTARLMLAKNPTGWAAVLPVAHTPTVILAVDCAAADGPDVSWLWDVDFDMLAGRTIIATGPRAQDLAVRLSHAGVDYRCIPDLAAAVAGHREPVDVIASRTPFQRLRRMAAV